MPRWGSIINLSRAEKPVIRAVWCDSFLCKLRGLTFRRKLAEGEGLLLVERSMSRSATSIHMFMVFFPITAAWLDSEFRVVDTYVAKPWRVYFPAAPAQYVLEGPVMMSERLAIGDQLAWRDA